MSCAASRVERNGLNIKVSERGRSANFINTERSVYFVTKVDDGIVKNQRAADYVVSKPHVGDVIVELKGGKVGYACEQIEATIAILAKCSAKRGPIAGLIVCTRVPAIDTKSQRLKNQFAKSHKSVLRISSGNRDHLFDSFFPVDR